MRTKPRRVRDNSHSSLGYTYMELHRNAKGMRLNTTQHDVQSQTNTLLQSCAADYFLLNGGVVAIRKVSGELCLY